MSDLGADQLDCLALMRQDGGGWSTLSSWRFYGNVRTIALCETLKAAGLVEGSDGEYDLTDAGYLLAVERQEALDALGVTAEQLRK